jgi:hypothetical protein
MKRSHIATGLAAGAVLALGGCMPSEPLETAQAASPARQCFFSRNVNSFKAVDDRTVMVRVGVRDIYELQLLTRCPDVDWSWSIAIKSTGSSICTGLDAELIVPSQIGPQRCPVRALRKLTREEVAALDPKLTP